MSSFFYDCCVKALPYFSTQILPLKHLHLFSFVDDDKEKNESYFGILHLTAGNENCVLTGGCQGNGSVFLLFEVSFGYILKIPAESRYKCV